MYRFRGFAPRKTNVYRHDLVTFTETYGIGSVNAAALFEYSGGIRHFANRDVYDSHSGTATIEWSSG